MSEEPPVRMDSIAAWHADRAQALALVYLADEVRRVATALEAIAAKPKPRARAPRKKAT